MAYIKNLWSTGDTITAALLNNVETQYDEVKTELEIGGGGSDIQPDGSNLVAGSVGDTQLGNRTADPTTGTAYDLAGTVTQHLSWLTKNIKALKGVAGNWYDTASMTIETLYGKFNASTGHKHTGAANDAPALAIPGRILDASGYYVMPGWAGTYTSSPDGYALIADRIFFIPIMLTEQTTFDGIAIYVVASAASSDARLGIYEWSNGAPGDLVLDAGTVSVATTGGKEIVINQTLDPGYYFLAVISDGAPEIAQATLTRMMTCPVSGPSSSIPQASTLRFVIMYTSGQTGVVSGGLPDPAPAITALDAVVPIVTLAIP